MIESEIQIKEAKLKISNVSKIAPQKGIFSQLFVVFLVHIAIVTSVVIIVCVIVSKLFHVLKT